jgi:hypothetical protein
MTPAFNWMLHISSISVWRADVLEVVYFFFVAFSAALVVLLPLPSPGKSQLKT